ncbi:hypothetical protein F0562_011681 [Nyssa sinensis]|uniref:Uncharacterized protein n=1 Tax=Nyssa sinensis TaxID=561372 RepID=A0A5J4ZV79_9ASTE|nr:hypothetical protein F0562_011681 [Nyssa sinensis]
MFIIEPGITVQLAIVDLRGIVDPEVALDVSDDSISKPTFLFLFSSGFGVASVCILFLLLFSHLNLRLMSIREDGRSKLPLLILTRREKTFMHQFCSGFGIASVCILFLLLLSHLNLRLMSIGEDGRSKLPLLVLTRREKTFMHQFCVFLRNMDWNITGVPAAEVDVIYNESIENISIRTLGLALVLNVVPCPPPGIWFNISFCCMESMEFHGTLGGFKDYDMLLGPIGRSNLSINVYGIEIIIINWESCMFIIVPGILAIVDFRGIVDPEVALDLLITISRDPE